ncbi:dennd5b [Symbiodinium natans]|uniref:Dennd5b protein n=1 Tax=Symbiodinium natans TaxID=878477 RepID=A0A812PCC6_9DINO|nr:dennd5b [Symbiodinium natans]
MSPLDPERAERNEELPELRMKCDGKLTPRSRPPAAPGVRRVGSYQDAALDSPTSDQTSTGGAYPEVAPPASCFAPRPPAELPARSSGRRVQAEKSQTPRQKGGSTSLPPVPLTARERYRQSPDLGASGSSVSSARRSRDSRDRDRSSSQHARTVAGVPSQELGTKSEPSRKLANTVAAVAAKPPQARAASPEIRGPSSEAPSCPSPAILDLLNDALGQEEVRRSSFHDILDEMEREKELWNEKMVALLSSSPSPPAPPAASSPSQLQNEAATVEEAVPSELDVEPPPAEPLEDVELGESVIARAMREAGIDPESTSMADLFAAAGDAEIGEIAEEVSEASTSRGGWRSSSRSWAAQLARRKKGRCGSGRTTPCGDV